MNGLWKENLGGWNHKDSKRKKQSRNNTLRDKGRALLKIQETKDIGIREEGDVEYIDPKKVYKNNFYIEIWKIIISKEDEYLFKNTSKIRYAYLWNNSWYDDYNDEKIISDNIDKLEFIYSTELIFDEEIKIKEPSYYWGAGSITTTFLFDKPLPYWKQRTFYNDGKRRKYAQKYASSMDRANLKEWVRKEDWDSEIKTHALSKSILWEIW